MSDEPLYELSEVNIRGPLGGVITSLDLTVRDNAVTALVGPVGSGKSTLLRLLSGRALPDGWELDGTWHYRGRALTLHEPGRAPLTDVAWVPQIRNAPVEELADPLDLEGARARIDGAFLSGARVILLDETERGLPEADREALVERLRRHRSKGAAIVISHDLAFTRAVADDVCLLCEGELVAHRSAPDFFDRPEPELAEQFVQHGTCARPPLLPGLPTHFHWLEPGRLAGMGRPGLLREMDDDLFAIAHAGVTVLVSLTEDPMPTTRLRPFGIAGRHFPIRDMGTPAMSSTVALCRDLWRALDRGEVVAVHCLAGLGRTGTILACMAVARGMPAGEAIDAVRAGSPGSIQTEHQAEFVHLFEAQR